MLRTIPVEQLKLGMYIHALSGAWVDHPFWKSQFMLQDASDLRKLQASAIQAVVIDTGLGMDVAESASAVVAPVAEPPASALPPPASAPENPLSFDEERTRAARIIQSSRRAVASMFKEIRLGKVVHTEAVLPLVNEIADSVSRNPYALVSLVRLKTVDDYTYMHSVAVCALMTALAKELKLSAAEVRQAGLAGLLHDIGKARVPQEILNKPGALTESEFEVIRQHPLLGHAKLLRANITDPVTLDVCLHHHEKVDGSGYPYRLPEAEISLFAKMAAVCDVYDAVTSTRAYKAAWDPSQALKRMASWKGHFDAGIFKAFVKSLGIYPIGSLVRLKSGRLAMVVDQTTDLLKPVVKAFFSTQSKLHIPVERMDLSLPGQDEIVGHESASQWGITQLDHVWPGHA
ncbi:MAG TPA: HD-GYP domain-containing protein [Methylophilus sp.]